MRHSLTFSTTRQDHKVSSRLWTLFAASFLLLITACGSIDPHGSTTPLEETTTEETTTEETTPEEPTTEEPTTEQPTIEPTGGVVGLHYTGAEVQVWRDRAVNGPFRVKGDAGTNSPGDWERIQYQADLFVADPGRNRWVGNTLGRCYAWGDPAPKYEISRHLRDAAFVYLINEDATYRDAVKAELLRLAHEPGLDFSNSSLWCLGKLRDGNPALEIANWFSQLLVAYDYLGEAAFAPEEISDLDAWFLSGAHYFKAELHFDLRKNFVDRLNDNYSLTSYAHAVNDAPKATTHYDGWDVYSMQMFYNNRRATAARFVALAGIKFGNVELQSHAKRFVKEFLKYGVFPDGVIGDFERWKTSLPDLGWSYSAKMLGSIVTIADAFARTGDNELYEYTTTEGYYGTQSSTPKSLWLALVNLQSYLISDPARYGTDSSADVGNETYLIDGKDQASGWHAVDDVMLVPANMYYRNETFRDIYLRDHPGADAYPAYPSQGHAPAWNGDWGLYPGVLFMYGEAEGIVDPMAAAR